MLAPTQITVHDHAPVHVNSTTRTSQSPPSSPPTESLLPPKSSSEPTLLIRSFGGHDCVVSGEVPDSDEEEMDTDMDNNAHVMNPPTISVGRVVDSMVTSSSATMATTSTTATDVLPPTKSHHTLLRRASSYPELSVKLAKPVLTRTRNVDFRKKENSKWSDSHTRATIEMRSRAPVNMSDSRFTTNNNGPPRNRRSGRHARPMRPPLLSSGPAKFNKRKGSIEIIFRPTAVPTLKRKSSF